MMFDRPPAGYSLTQEPKGAPFENPPEINDPAEAARYHLNRLSDPELMEDAMFFLEQGVDIMSLVQGILRGAVMQGQHSIDVSLIIAPVLHEFIKQAADVTDTPYEEGFDDKESKAVIVVFSFKYPLLKSFNARETISLLFLLFVILLTPSKLHKLADLSFSFVLDKISLTISEYFFC